MKLKYLLVFALLSIFGCKNKIEKSGALLNYIPESAGLIVKINDLSRLKSELKNNTFILSLNTVASYKKAVDKIEILNYIDTDSHALLAFVPSGTDSTEVLFVLPLATNLQIKDSLITRSEHPNMVNGLSIEKYVIEDQSFFKAIHNDNLLITGSFTLMERIIENSAKTKVNANTQCPL